VRPQEVEQLFTAAALMSQRRVEDLEENERTEASERAVGSSEHTALGSLDVDL